MHIVPPEVYVSGPAMLSAELRNAELARGRADLLVMGSHGRSGAKKLALGSVSEEVIRRG